jgi:hypothetical protein
VYDEDVKRFLELEYSNKFEWGVNDCVQLSARAVRVFFGKTLDLPQYTSEMGAKRILAGIAAAHPGDKRHPLEIATSAVLGPPKPQHTLIDCPSGSVVLSSFHGEYALGVSWRRYFFVYITDKSGLLPVDLTLAIKYWPCHNS